MNLAFFFNPTNLKHDSISCVLQIFDKVNELKVMPISLKYIDEAMSYLDQADSFNVRKGRKENGFFSKLRRFFFAMQYSGVRSFFENLGDADAVAVAWNARSDVRFIFMQAARDAGAKTLYLELAPFPNSIAVDPRGINYLNTVPRDRSFYQSYSDKSDGWRYLEKYIAQRSVVSVDTSRKYLLTSSYIFVALQTEGDSQLVDFGGNYKTVSAFLNDICLASCALAPGRHVLVKEHPGKKESLAALVEGYPNVHIVNEFDTVQLIKGADLVLTVNSSVGLEAMILERPVAASGLAFWSVPSIAYSAKNLSELKDLFGANSFEVSADLRSAFLNFLDKDYYIHLNWQANGKCRIPEPQLQKIRKFLS